MAFPKRNNAFKAPMASAPPTADKSADVAPEPKESNSKPVNYKRGAYKKSGKVQIRKAFAGLMNKNKSSKI